MRSWPEAPAEQCLGEHGIALADVAVGGEIAVAHAGTDPHAAVLARLDAVERQAADVDHELGAGDPQLHVVDQVGPAGEEYRVGPTAQRGDGAGDVVGPEVLERCHWWTALMAARMLT